MSARIEDIDDSDVLRMYEVEGMTYQEIADYYGVCQAFIYFRLHPDKKKEANRKYRSEHLEQVKERSKKYRSDHLEQVIERDRKWKQEHPEYAREYWQTPNGKACIKKQNSNRRELGFVPLNNPFPGSVFHHIDEEHGMYIPVDIHRSIPHNVWTGQGMEEINTIAFHYITKEETLEVDRIFTNKEYTDFARLVNAFVKKVAKRFDITEEDAIRRIERELKWYLMGLELKKEKT